MAKRRYSLFHMILISMLISIEHGRCGKSSRWDSCNCRFLDWQSWQSCDATCNGQMRRMRRVQHSHKCQGDFTMCASNDMGWDYSRCNQFCYNGGTSDGYMCSCVTGFYGKCCNHKVTCGNPGSLSNGWVSGSNFKYGGRIYYHCNSGYKLIGRYSSRQCQKRYTWDNDGVWGGSKPRCAYYNSCSSSPCKNGATCTNVPDRYRCSCAKGWAGKQCTIDVQPPSVSGCPEDMELRTSTAALNVSWNPPSFWDPHGNKVQVSSNYPKNSWMFPWGDFTISFSALKSLNGLKTECVFNVRIRPHPCKSLTVPLNGAVVCNQWRTDYGRVCTNMCHTNYTVPRGLFPNQWYVCISSGSWMPGEVVTKCSVPVAKLPTKAGYNFGASFNSCQNEDDVKSMQTYYIKELRESPFKFLCDKFEDECTESNVSVVCQ